MLRPGGLFQPVNSFDQFAYFIFFVWHGIPFRLFHIPLFHDRRGRMRRLYRCALRLIYGVRLRQEMF